MSEGRLANEQGEKLSLKLREFVVLDDVGPVFEDPVASKLLACIGGSQCFDDVGQPVANLRQQPRDDVTLVCGCGGEECVEFFESTADRRCVERGHRRCWSRFVSQERLSGCERSIEVLAPPLGQLRVGRAWSEAGLIRRDALFVAPVGQVGDEVVVDDGCGRVGGSFSCPPGEPGGWCGAERSGDLFSTLLDRCGDDCRFVGIDTSLVEIGDPPCPLLLDAGRSLSR